MIQTDIEGKVFLVAGATGGIGSGVARQLSQAGAILVLMGRNVEMLQKLQNGLEGKSYLFACDFSETEKLCEVFPFIKNEGIKLDGMVYAAGISEGMPVKAVDVSEMQRNMQINYYAYVELCKGFAGKRYSNEGSSIVAMSSIASIMCEKGMSQYAASKAALNAATKSMAKEFARRRIRLNALAPAFVDTKMAWGTEQTREDFEAYLAERQPFGIIPVEEIANLTEFLLSSASAHITGEIITVGAGMY